MLEFTIVRMICLVNSDRQITDHHIRPFVNTAPVLLHLAFPFYYGPPISTTVAIP